MCVTVFIGCFAEVSVLMAVGWLAEGKHALLVSLLSFVWILLFFLFPGHLK